MTHHGMHHLGLATHNMEATLDFYENKLGFETKVCDLLKPEAGGTITSRMPSLRATRAACSGPAPPMATMA